MIPWRHITIAAVAAIALAGCASNGSLSAGEKAALREVAAIGVERYVRENADSARVEQIRAVLVELQQLPDITTVDGLRALVQASMRRCASVNRYRNSSP